MAQPDDVKGLGTALVALLWLNVALSAASILIVPLGMMVDLESGGAGAIVYGLAAGLVGLGTVGAVIITAVAFCMFLHRIHGALARRGHHMEFGPNGYGWFFVPFANLFKPRQLVLEQDTLLQAGAPVGPWWGTWIVGNILSNVSMRLTMALPDEAISNVVDVASSAVMIAAAVLAMNVVRAFVSAVPRLESVERAA